MEDELYVHVHVHVEVNQPWSYWSLRDCIRLVWPGNLNIPISSKPVTIVSHNMNTLKTQKYTYSMLTVNVKSIHIHNDIKLNCNDVQCMYMY